MKKNDIIELQISDIGVNGEGIGHFENLTFFVKDALPGDVVRAVVTRIKKGYAFAKTLEILVPSADRVIPACPVASQCGGCQIMQLDYKKQLHLKKEKVRNNLERIGGVPDPCIKPVIGMDEALPLNFRNKVQFPLGVDKNGSVIYGFYAGRTHYIIGTKGCPVAMPEAGVIMESIRQFAEENRITVYNEESGTGLLRHVLIRKGFATGQIMACVVINGDSLGKGVGGMELSRRLVDGLTGLDLSQFGDSKVASISLNINKARTNVILGDRVITLYGTTYIEEKLEDLTFRISPLAFFQVNTTQAERLFGKALEYAALSGNETVWDLYCGTGTISLFLARKAKAVYGVEIIQAAIDNANENAVINGIENAQFFCGKSEEIFPEFYSSCQYKSRGEAKLPPYPDVVVLDPPRKGCDKALLDAILEVEPERIVYVSCDSATLARDIKILSKKYSLEEATPADLFPHTVHVEVIALLQLSNRKPDAKVRIDVNLEDYYRIKNKKQRAES